MSSTLNNKLKSYVLLNCYDLKIKSSYNIKEKSNLKWFEYDNKDKEFIILCEDNYSIKTLDEEMKIKYDS